jgi:APA family basic amino acid/polyamine antiporter
MTAASNSGLVRSLRRWDLVGVVLNGVIGAGIFGLPSRVFALTGDYSLLCFTVCALCVSLIVLSFAEVASRFSGTGGPYLFAREAYGPLTGFVVGWLVWIARVTSLAANCTLLPAYLGFFFPAAASGLPRAIIVICVVTALATVNVRGVRGTADASNVLAVGKLLPLGVFAVAGLLFLQPGRFSFALVPTYHAFSQSVLLLVYAFTGFEMAVIPAGEVRSPGGDLPPALLIGMAVVVTVYMLIQLVCIGTLPGLAGSQRPLADAAASFLGTWGAAMIMGGIVVSLAGNLNVLILAASRLLFAMAERDELPAELAAVHPRFRTPAAAVLVTTAIMLILTLSGTFIHLVTLSTLARLVTYFATCGALVVLRRRERAAVAVFRVPAGVFIALAGMLLCIWLLSSTSLREARDAVLAAAAGLAIYWLHRRIRPASHKQAAG